MKIEDYIENVNGTKQKILFVLQDGLYVIRDEVSKEVYIEEIEQKKIDSKEYSIPSIPKSIDEPPAPEPLPHQEPLEKL